MRQILFVEQTQPGVLVLERSGPNQWTETELTSLDEVFFVNGREVALQEIYAEVY